VLLPLHLVVAICYFLLFFFVLNPIGWLLVIVDGAMVIAPAPVKRRVRGVIRQELKIASSVQIDAPVWLVQVLIDKEDHWYGSTKSSLQQAEREALHQGTVEELRHQVQAYEAIPRSSRVGDWKWECSSGLTRALRVWWGIDPVLDAHVHIGYGPWVQYRVRFSGLLVALFGRKLERDVRASLDAYNHTLKARAEQLARQWE
jgi:hypothetical protein